MTEQVMDERFDDAVVQRVLEHLRLALPHSRRDDLTLDTPLLEIGLDSLATMDAVNGIETKFRIRISESAVYDLETCRDLVELVQRSTRATRSGQVTAGRVLATQVAEPESARFQEVPREQYDVTQFPECVAFGQRLANLKAAGYANPFFRVSYGASRGTARIDGREVISYTSFDYLGLGKSRDVVEAAKEAIDQFGTSASASRLVGGESSMLGDLDRELAAFLGTEAALVLPSGYGTNASLLGHMFGADDLILYDELAHNSIVQGSSLSQARRRPFPHNDYAFLDRLLGDLRAHHRRVVVAIEGLYSMDGDYPDLPRFIEVKQRHGALLYVDEAHSLGVLGPTGRGVCEHFGVAPLDGDFWMGTISKSLCSGGGYIAGRHELIQYLKYTVPAVVFATAPSPANAAASLAALRAIQREPERLSRLRDRAAQFRALARAADLNTGHSQSTSIVPIILGDSLRCMIVAERLLEAGIDARPILYPAVPESGARIRFFITADHTEQQIEHTVRVLADTIAQIHDGSTEVSFGL